MATYKKQCYLLMTTDPVHIGTGGYRLGRVDNSIVREPGTRIPKIPGTSLHGAARSYAAYLYEKPQCAGPGNTGGSAHCGQQNCPICYTFGNIKKTGNGDEVQTYSGVVNIFDAHMLLFPVHSMAGPVWVSTISRLREAGFTVGNIPNNGDGGGALLTWERNNALNLGWLMVKGDHQVVVKAPDKWKDTEHWKAIASRIVLVPEALFSQVVNSNLEVRTSVAIDPERGAAEEGMLFTYEALPRATFLTVEVVLDDYRREGEFWPLGEVKETNPKNGKSKPLPGGSWNDPLDVVKAGLKMIEWLGVGGMGTRGFGRMAIVGEPREQSYSTEEWQ
jgi:CRISPR-associated protein Cmr4